MSTLIVDVCQIEEIKPHPQADRLCLARVKGWWIIVQISLNLQVGQKVIFIPPDSVIPDDYAEKLGITKYCTPLPKNPDGSRLPGLRVRAARLRGVPSEGTIDQEVPEDWEVGKNVRDLLGITKYQPPIKALDGDAAADKSTFYAYTSLENIRNFPDVIKDGEEVQITEKLHGKNLRVGLIWDESEEGKPEQVWMAGSHGVRRKQFNNKGALSDFWRPLQDECLKDAISAISREYAVDGKNANVIFYGELINTQKGFYYGCASNSMPTRFFDISVNGKYLDRDRMMELCDRFSIPTVPALYRGPFSREILEEYTTGPTTMCDAALAGNFKGREGIVVVPTKERYDGLLGRVILKSINVDYTEYTTGKGKEDTNVADI